MPTDFQRLNAEEQKIARLIAARLIVSVADVAAAIVETERCTKLVHVPGLTLQVCEAYHELLQTSQEEAERVLKENLLHCAAEATLGDHDLGQWQQTEGPGIVAKRQSVSGARRRRAPAGWRYTACWLMSVRGMGDRRL